MIVWCNGCFDVIHAGHIELLKFAKSQGDFLVVGLDSDERVKQNKGETRPVNSLQDRIKVLESIRYVDKVVSFCDEKSLKEAIETSGAECIIIGDDYKDKNVIGTDILPVVFFPRLENLSSTRIINETATLRF